MEAAYPYIPRPREVCFLQTVWMIWMVWYSYDTQLTRSRNFLQTPKERKKNFREHMKTTALSVYSFPKTQNERMPFLLKTRVVRLSRCVLAEIFCRGDLTVPCKLDVPVRTPVFCLCWAYITGPFESLLRWCCKTELNTGLMGLWELYQFEFFSAGIEKDGEMKKSGGIQWQDEEWQK